LRTRLHDDDDVLSPQPLAYSHADPIGSDAASGTNQHIRLP